MINQRTRTIVSALSLSLALAGVAACKSEVDDKPKAKVEDAEKPAEKPAPAEAEKPAGEAKTLALATQGSKVGFIGAKVTGDHKGSFDKFTGSATVEGDKLTAIEVTVEMDSMTTDAEDLTGHLKGEDFFNVAAHPQAKFTSLSITEKAGEGGATHEVAGNLEMKGVAKKVTFPATITLGEDGATGKAEFAVNRKEWGIDYPGKPDDLIKDEVALTLDLKFE
jgi:polyisoprenoid-binding protein YceI